MIGKVQRGGLTLIPTKMYFKKEAKIEIAVAKGKKQYDKRQSIKKRDWNVIEQDILENPAKSIYLSIGTNLGDKKLNINKAKIYLEEIGIKILSSSCIYESQSWPTQIHQIF